MTYARGTYARGQCQRCGFEYMLLELRPEEETNLLVCDDCRDEPRPERKWRSRPDRIALRRPAPDLDREDSST